MTELRRRRRSLAQSVGALAALALGAGALAVCAVAFVPSAGATARAALRALPALVALLGVIVSRTLHPRDPVARAAVRPPGEVLAGALARVAEGRSEQARPGESAALLARWFAAAEREATGLPRELLGRTALRRAAPALATLLVPAVLALAAPARFARGTRALFVPGGQWDGARVARVAALESAQSVLAGHPAVDLAVAHGVVRAPAGGLLVLRGHLEAGVVGAHTLALRDTATRRTLAETSPVNGAFELAFALEADVRARLECEDGRGERTRDPEALTIVALPDTAPEVAWRDDGAPVTLELDPEEVPWRVLDDRGVTHVAVVYTREQHETRRAAAYPEPGTRELSGEVSLEPGRVLPGSVVQIEATDDGGQTARSAPRRVIVLGVLERHLNRVDALRRALEQTRALLAQREAEAVPESPAAGAARFRALETPTEALSELLLREVGARTRDPLSSRDASATFAMMGQRLTDLLDGERDATVPDAAPHETRVTQDARARHELHADVDTLEALLRGELARAVEAVARSLRAPRTTRESAGERLERLERAARGSEHADAVAAARSSLAQGQELPQVADALAPRRANAPASAAGGGESEAARRFTHLVLQALADERAILQATQTAGSAPPVPPAALEHQAREVEALQRAAAAEDSSSRQRLSTRLQHAHDALRAGDLRTGRAVLEATQGDSWSLPQHEAERLSALVRDVQRLSSTAAQRAALTRLGGRQRGTTDTIGRLRTEARAGAAPQDITDLLTLAYGGGLDAQDGLARGDPRDAVAGESRTVTTLEELLNRSQENESGEGEGEPRDGTSADGRARSHDRVDVPGPEAFVAPRARRRAVIDALRNGVPEGYAPAALGYARWLLR